MKTQEMYQVDAFASELFAGNPAAVCILEKWLPDAIIIIACIYLLHRVANEKSINFFKGIRFNR